jgi:hypothetical protein
LRPAHALYWSPASPVRMSAAPVISQPKVPKPPTVALKASRRADVLDIGALFTLPHHMVKMVNSLHSRSMQAKPSAERILLR